MTRNRGAAPHGIVFSAAALFVLLVAVPPVFAAHSGAVPPMPDVRPNPALPLRPVETPRLPFPGMVDSSAVVQDRVHPMYPQDGAAYPNGGVVTLGWTLPDRRVLPDELRIVPDRFELVVANDRGEPPIRKILPFTLKSAVYHCLVSVPGSGRYQWQVAAIMPSGEVIKAPNRVFTVLPK
ncbi:MAG: hypothetical protein LBJ46_02715 [Planctomycetota bacterium]|nr:hypothetical protein [Planctomycetota bacterium]